MRRDKKHRVLRRGESVRADGKYQFKYHVDGKPKFVYSWKLEPTDPLPVGKRAGKTVVKHRHKPVDTRIDADERHLKVRGVKQASR